MTDQRSLADSSIFKQAQKKDNDRLDAAEIAIKKITVTVEAFGAIGDGIADDTAAWRLALNSGASRILGTPGKTYKVDPLVITNPSVKFIGADSVFSLMCNVSANDSIGLTTLSGVQFFELKNVHFFSSGNGADSKRTIGVRADSASILQMDGVRAFGFSSRAIQIRGCVAAVLSRLTINCDARSSCYALSLEKLNGIPCTTVTVTDPYIFGGQRGIFGEGVVALTIIAPKFEYSGDQNAGAQANAAMHLIACTGAIIGDYYEENERDIIMVDCRMPRYHTPFKAGGKAVDSFTNVGLAFTGRGYGYMDNRTLIISEINGDPYTGGDLGMMTPGGRLGIGTSTPDSKLHVVAPRAGLRVGFNGISRNYYDADSHILRNEALNELLIVRGGAILPGADNVMSVGTPEARFTQVFSATGTINTSDERQKDNIGVIPDAWLDAWSGVEWCKFQFKDAIALKGDNARWHLGLIAQRVQAAFETKGLNAFSIGLLCHDTWEAEPAVAEIPEVLDDDGRLVTPHQAARDGREAGSLLGLRYDECQAIDSAWQRREITRLTKRIADLEVPKRKTTKA